MKKIFFLILSFFSIIAHGDITWDAPVAISSTKMDASDPEVVIDVNGNATSVWVENNVIWASVLTSGSEWTAPSPISNAANASSNPKLGIDGSGNVTAIWIENSIVMSARLPLGGNWETESAISSSGASNPSLAIDVKGNVVAVWERNTIIESATKISGSWNKVATLSSSNSNHAHVYMNNTGNAIAVWHSVVSGADTIVTSLLTISRNTWATPIKVFSGVAALFHDYPKGVLDDSGNATIAWFRYDFLNGNAYQNVQVLTSTLLNGGAAWAIPKIISEAGLRNPKDLIIKLGIDVSGDVIALWTHSIDGETFLVQSSRKLYGGDWQSFTMLNVPNLFYLGIDLSMASGSALAAYMKGDEKSSIVIQSQESDLTPSLQSWTIANTVSSGLTGYPKCALSINKDTFNAVCVWVAFDGNIKNIQASKGSRSVVASPSNISVKQSVTDFYIYQNYYNAITWDASPATNIIQYNIFRNGVFIGSTLPAVLEYVDNNSTPGEKLVYGITALTSDYRQSEVATFTLNP